VRGMNERIRVVVVDDQAFMRIALRRMIEAEGDIAVIGEARDGHQALELAQRLKPDAITMDVEMPGLDGIEACGRIMREVSPPPAIVMVSAHTQKGAADTIEAMRRGAVDFVSKSSLFVKTDLARIEAELRPMLRAWSHRRPAAVDGDEAEATRSAPPDPVVGAVRFRRLDLVMIAASTGGPQALTILLRALGPIRPAIVIAQHMPPLFTRSLAGLLASDTGLPVVEAAQGAALSPGSVSLIPGGSHGVVQRVGGELRLRLLAAGQQGEEISPSADRLFESATSASAACAAVVLTGMGRDGSAGAAALHPLLFPILVQQPSECIVGGMPEAVIERGLATAVLPLAGIADWIRRNTA